MISPETILRRVELERTIDTMLQATYRGSGEAIVIASGMNLPKEDEEWILKLYGTAWGVKASRGHNKELSFEFSHQRN